MVKVKLGTSTSYMSLSMGVRFSIFRMMLGVMNFYKYDYLLMCRT